MCMSVCLSVCHICTVCMFTLCGTYVCILTGALVAASGSNDGNLTSSEGSQSSLQNSTLSSIGDQGRYATVTSHHRIITHWCWWIGLQEFSCWMTSTVYLCRRWLVSCWTHSTIAVHPIPSGWTPCRVESETSLTMPTTTTFEVTVTL